MAASVLSFNHVGLGVNHITRLVSKLLCFCANLNSLNSPSASNLLNGLLQNGTMAGEAACRAWTTDVLEYMLSAIIILMLFKIHSLFPNTVLVLR